MMKKKMTAAGAAFVLGLAMSVAASAQATAPAGRAQGARVAPGADEVALIGCVEFESDYRKRMAAGRGGVLGTGVGAGDEFVLTNVRPAAAEVGTTGAAAGRGRGSANAAGRSNAGAGGGVYTLTGPQEKDLKRDVGRQVTVVGTIENAGKSSTGADVTDVSDLPRVAIATWHPVGDFCPAK
jgi:hypothetical protein